jgi:hypothetical protein
MSEFTADELRQTAKQLEEAARAGLDAYSTTPPRPAQGDLQFFGRPSPEDQAAEEGLAILQEETGRKAAMLYAVARAMEQRTAIAKGGGAPIPEAWMIQVRPYVEAFRAGTAAQKKP